MSDKRMFEVEILDATTAYGDPKLIVRFGKDALKVLGVVRTDQSGYAGLPSARAEILDKLQDALRTFHAARTIVNSEITALKEVEILLERVRENLRMYGKVRGLGGGL